MSSYCEKTTGESLSLIIIIHKRKGETICKYILGQLQKNKRLVIKYFNKSSNRKFHVGLRQEDGHQIVIN